MSIIVTIVVGIVGYVVGVMKSFREQKLRAYEEIMPVFIRAAFNPSSMTDEKEFNQALIKLWLFAGRKVALKFNDALACLVDPKRGDPTEALQSAIAQMRSDIQWAPWHRVSPKEVGHFYTRFEPKAEKAKTK